LLFQRNPEIAKEGIDIYMQGVKKKEEKKL